ncbi:geranylgeranyl reductase family protein [Sporomusa acidovorans]|uniref:geranylgeranyl reductase family protein n=1 Tax=Sporomusa acidovorans TaxID=112900 RepID=UPI00146D34E7|nr:NAD(P)/FAD-dependent oxidoreductase [Sporomusa acidovorans]
MKPPDEYYDAVVIGAGPAGSTAAKRLGQAGLKVALLDQRLEIGNKIQCAEFVPRPISRYAPLRAGDIAQRVEGIKTFINGKPVHTLAAPGYTLNRNLWDKYQADEAKNAGVTVMSATRAVAVGDHAVTITKGTERGKIYATFILGCDGPHSLVSGRLGNGRQENCVALQYELLLHKPMTHVEIYFEPDYYGGYAWAFPKGNTVNAGIAIHASVKNQLHCLLHEFCRSLMQRQVVQSDRIVAKTGGFIPTGGLAGCLAQKNMLLAGDAAGCTHPVTGAGIMNAVRSGHLAAMAVIRQVKSKDEHLVSENYPRILHEEYSRQFAIARERLNSRNREWTNDPEKFLALIRRSWIAFPEYYTQ